jgi:hypothetical protein
MPDYEDDTSKAFILAENGDYSLVKIASKKNGRTKYLVARQDDHGEWDAQSFLSEALARDALRKMAGAA